MADQQSQLVAKEAAKAALTAVLDDTSTAEAEKLAAETLVADLTEANLVLEVDKVKLGQASDKADDALEAAEDIITKMDGGVFNSDITVNGTDYLAGAGYEGLIQELANVADVAADLTDAEAALAAAQAELVVLEADNATALAYEATKETALTTAEAAEAAALQVTATAQLTFDIAQQELANQSANLNAALTAVADQEDVVETKQTALDEATEDLTDAQADLAEDQADLVAANAAKAAATAAVLAAQVVAADAPALQTAAEVAQQIIIDAAQVTLDAAIAATAVAQAAYDATPNGTTLLALQQAQAAEATAQAARDAAQEVFDDISILADANQAVTDAQTAETTAITAVFDAEAAINDVGTGTQDLADAAQATVDTAQDELDAELVILAEKEADVVTELALADASAELAARDAAQVALNDATALSDAATTAKGTAQTEFDAASALVLDDQGNMDPSDDTGTQALVTAKIAEIGAYDGTGDPADPDNYTGLEADLIEAQNAVATAAEDTAEITALIAACQADYDAAVLALAGLQTAADAAADAVDANEAQIAANDAMISELEAVILVLGDYIDGGVVMEAAESEPVKIEIETLTDEIETLKAQIEATQDALADNVISETELNAKIVVETNYLNALIAERDALQEAANQYFALYLAALG
ncbi:MAG: hypothetical protein O2887_17760 [Bacteroidetes bacterium]|nr:hypothetical protein [Bacteroidota bacterium]MDA1122303.1 hypothetical protein [Bacteroidota bacterium]